MSDELKLKLSLAKKGKIFTDEHRKNLSLSHKGNMPTNIEQLRNYNKGRPLSEEHKRNIGLKHKGKIISEETRRKIGLAGLGRKAWNKGIVFLAKEKNPNWISDRSKLKKFNRQIGGAHSEWVNACKIRDGKKCKLGGKDCCGKLEVHHIFRFSEYLERRYDITNGITLCHFHHPRKKQDEERMRDTFIKLIS